MCHLTLLSKPLLVELHFSVAERVGMFHGAACLSHGMEAGTVGEYLKQTI